MPDPTQPLAAALLAAIDHRPGPDDRQAAALHLLDWLGCALAGAATDTGRAMAVTGGAAAVHPLAFRPVAPGEMAWMMGGLGSLLEMDDVHRTAILHPGPVVMPAVLACVTPDTAHRAAEAALRGYEAMVRLGRSVGPGHYARFHNTSTCGGIGAAVAAAWMLGLEHEQTLWAIAHALSLSGGLWECRNAPGATKHLHVAEAARRGVQAALAARAGIAGPPRILEGPQGFYAGLAPDGTPGMLLQGQGWALHDTSFKPWPACRHAHPAIDAALALRQRLAGQTPGAIRVETYGDAVLFCDRPEPQEPAAARFSLQHCVAVALADGPPPLPAFEGAALHRPDLAALRAICVVAEDKAMTARYPAHFGARVTLDIGGTVVSHTIDDAWGDSENPMDADAVIAKYRGLADWAGADPAVRDSIKAAALDMAQGDGALTLLTCLAALPPPPQDRKP